MSSFTMRLHIVLLTFQIICFETVACQSLSSLPVCEQICFNNEVAAANDFGCSSNNIACLCDNSNFQDGVKDCSAQSCPADADLSSLTAFLSSYCNAAIASASTSAVTSLNRSTTLIAASTVDPSLLLTGSNLASIVLTLTSTSHKKSHAPASTTYTIFNVTSTATILESSKGLRRTTFTYSSTITNAEAYMSLLQNVSWSSSHPSTTLTAIPTIMSIPGSDFSVGAKVGIGIGIAVGIVVSIIITILIIMLRRRSSSVFCTGCFRVDGSDDDASPDDSTLELAAAASESAEKTQPREMPTHETQYAELYGSPTATEMRAKEDISQVQNAHTSESACDHQFDASEV